MKLVELNHVAIHVSDVDRSCEFYANIIQLERIPRPAFDFPGAWFRLGSIQELHIIGGRTDPVISHNRGNHFALRAENLEEWREHLSRLNLIIRGPVRRPDGAMQIFTRDPDGHIIEVFTGP
jgi:lactoylglutathione lyase